MATIDGRPAQYGITLKQLRELMETRGREGIAKVQDYGGVQEICKKLYTSPSEGNYKLLLVFCNLTLFAIFTSTFSKLCKNIYNGM
jgi:hypothetical protein